jgi:hypothetical protein
MKIIESEKGKGEGNRERKKGEERKGSHLLFAQTGYSQRLVLTSV